MCMNCRLQYNDTEWELNKDSCAYYCLHDNSFIVVGKSDRTAIHDGWGIIDVNTECINKTTNLFMNDNYCDSGYAILNKKNHPHSYLNPKIRTRNQRFYFPFNFIQSTTGNIRVNLERLYDPRDRNSNSDIWGNLYNIEKNTPDMDTCLTIISSGSFDDDIEITSETPIFTQIPENIPIWDVLCTKAIQYCSAPTPSPTLMPIQPINIPNDVCQGKDLEIVLYIDASYSIKVHDTDESNSERFEHLKEFVSVIAKETYYLIKELSNSVKGSFGDDNSLKLKMSIISFSAGVNLNLNYNDFGDNGIINENDLDNVIERINNIELPGDLFRQEMDGTHTKEAIETYFNNVLPLSNKDRKTVSSLQIMFTDGLPHPHPEQLPCPDLGYKMINDSKSIFYLVTLDKTELSDLSAFRCLFVNSDKQIIELVNAFDLFEIKNMIKNIIFSQICDLQNFVCNYPLYPSIDIDNISPKYGKSLLYNKTLTNDIIKYTFDIRSINDEIITESYKGNVWIEQISIPIYGLKNCIINNDIEYNNISIVIKMFSSDNKNITHVVTSETYNINKDNYIELIYIYNITLPIRDHFGKEFRMKQKQKYTLQIEINGAKKCSNIGKPIYIPCIQQPGPTILPATSYNSWYYFNNIFSYINDDDKESKCIPQIWLCLVEPTYHFPSPSPTTSPTNTPTYSPTPSPSNAPTNSPTPSPTESPTPYPTNAPTNSPSNSPTPNPTNSPTPSPTNSPTPSPTESPSPAPTMEPTPGPTNSPTPSPTNSPTPSPTFVPTDSPSNSPTNAPTESPTPSPTDLPTSSPSDSPTPGPTQSPTPSPTMEPTPAPTTAPSLSPTDAPTESPTALPTNSPTFSPTPAPTSEPTPSPSVSPTPAPSDSPSGSPTIEPTFIPTAAPSSAPTNSPTDIPTFSPTGIPTDSPTPFPTDSPTPSPTSSPSPEPTIEPTMTPTNDPTSSPTPSPTNAPTPAPTSDPSNAPTSMPTGEPTGSPTNSPTPTPTDSPTDNPTDSPTPAPTNAPSSLVT